MLMQRLKLLERGVSMTEENYNKISIEREAKLNRINSDI
jgi:hypothetical protein